MTPTPRRNADARKMELLETISDRLAESGLDPQRYYSIQELAARWGYSEDHTVRLVEALDRAGIPILKIGKSVRLVRLADRAMASGTNERRIQRRGPKKPRPA